jgi:hypothetical protein
MPSQRVTKVRGGHWLRQEIIGYKYPYFVVFPSFYRSQYAIFIGWQSCCSGRSMKIGSNK